MGIHNSKFLDLSIQTEFTGKSQETAHIKAYILLLAGSRAFV